MYWQRWLHWKMNIFICCVISRFFILILLYANLSDKLTSVSVPIYSRIYNYVHLFMYLSLIHADLCNKIKCVHLFLLEQVNCICIWKNIWIFLLFQLTTVFLFNMWMMIKTYYETTTIDDFTCGVIGSPWSPLDFCLVSSLLRHFCKL